MARDFGQGIFTMEFISSIEKLDLATARSKAHDVVQASSATDKNKQKAAAMLDKASNVTKLMLGMSSFSLAHQGLKVL